MCCCEKPNVNGEFGYKWNQPNGPAGIHPPNPPDIPEGHILLFDEPGRCNRGDGDSHSFHYRVAADRGCDYRLYVRHGGGDESFRISSGRAVVTALTALDSYGRYWVLNAMYHAAADKGRAARDKEHQLWVEAAAQKRIKTRRFPARGHIKVWIEPLKVEGLTSGGGAE